MGGAVRIYAKLAPIPGRSLSLAGFHAPAARTMLIGANN